MHINMIQSKKGHITKMQRCYYSPTGDEFYALVQTRSLHRVRLNLAGVCDGQEVERFIITKTHSQELLDYR